MMQTKAIAAFALCFGLAACGGAEAPPDRSSLSTAGEGVAMRAAPVSGRPVFRTSYRVTEVRVAVPRALRVSEANAYYPLADIVWRGDALGDRYAQVGDIFRAAAASGTLGIEGARPVVAEIEVVRFHCLTEKTRIMIGGVYSMRFLLTVRDAATGRVLDGPRMVIADKKGAGGVKAMAQDAAGLTQKVEVTQRLSEVIRRELAGMHEVPAGAFLVPVADTAAFAGGVAAIPG